MRKDSGKKRYLVLGFIKKQEGRLITSSIVNFSEDNYSYKLYWRKGLEDVM